ESAGSARERGVLPLALLAGGALSGGEAGSRYSACEQAIRLALNDAGLAASEIRCAVVSAGAESADDPERRAVESCCGADCRVMTPSDWYGNVEGAGGALQTAGAIFEGAAGGMPALVLTSDPSGTAAALVTMAV
ncbi:MAG: hypothetical protein PHR35_20775, partial [Kiritimatiellae bacterium]|nr:hypothetical protein [Kiritimatiellia bacterium]